MKDAIEAQNLRNHKDKVKKRQLESELASQSIAFFENPDKEKLIRKNASQENFFSHNKDHNLERAKKLENNRSQLYQAIIRNKKTGNDKKEQYYRNNM